MCMSQSDEYFPKAQWHMLVRPTWPVIYDIQVDVTHQFKVGLEALGPHLSSFFGTICEQWWKAIILDPSAMLDVFGCPTRLAVSEPCILLRAHRDGRAQTRRSSCKRQA